MQRITYYEREQIEHYLRTGKKKRWIAIRLKRDHSVIVREIKNHTGEHLPYTAKMAREIADRKKKNANKRKVDKNENLKKHVTEKLKADWSPEQIAGRLETEPPANLLGLTLSHESIYDFVYNHADKSEELYNHLRYKRKARQPHYARKKRSSPIKNKTSIELRPAKITERKEYGHWETDLVMVGKYPICVSVERKSLLCRLNLLENKQAQENEAAIGRVIETTPAGLFLSLTRDNGCENALHEETQNVLNVPSYFCHPYASWEKGTIENLNGLLRQYFPKKAKDIIPTPESVCLVENKLNNRPRKKNDYLTPNEIFEKLTLVVQ